MNQVELSKIGGAWGASCIRQVLGKVTLFKLFWLPFDARRNDI